MKLKMLTGLLVTATILSCSQSPKVDSMAGVYKMEKQLMNDGVKDYTFLASEGNTQYRDWETDRKSTRLNSSHSRASRMPSSA